MSFTTTKTGVCSRKVYSTESWKSRIVASLLLCILGAMPIPSWAGTYQWTSSGPEGGLIVASAISPNYATDGTVFAGTYGGGVYKSTNGGQSWTQMNNGITNLYVESVAISPNYLTDATVFVGTGCNVVDKSTDGGQTWTLSGITLTQTGGYDCYVSLAISPNYATDATIFAVASLGVYKSTDGGQTWTYMNKSGISDFYVEQVTISPNYAADSTVFANSVYDGRLFKSTDGGQSWTQIQTNTELIRMVISPNYATDATLFAVDPFNGASKSTNGGQTWTQNNSMITSTNIIVTAVAISPNYATDATVFVGTEGNAGGTEGNGVYKSTDGGQTWTQINSGLTNVNIISIAISPNYATDATVFANTPNGVCKSTNGGQSWTQMDNGLKSAFAIAIAISPNYATDATVFAGTDDNGLYKSTDGGQDWSLILPNSGLADWQVQSIAISPNYATDATAFASIGAGGVYKSTNGGQTWTQINSGLPSYSVGPSTYTGAGTIAISPNYAKDATVFMGIWYYGVYKSTNGGQTWTQMNNGITDTFLTPVAISPNYATDATVFAGASDGEVYKSTNGGQTWTLMINTHADIASLAMSPNYTTDGTVFAGAGGIGGGIYKSTNGGQTWAQMNNGLPSVPWGTFIDLFVGSVAISPNYASDATVFATAGFNYGLVLMHVYKSTDGGQSWTEISNGLPNTSVGLLAVSPNYAKDTTVFASTVGDGIFIYSVPAGDFSLSPVSPMTAMVGGSVSSMVTVNSINGFSSPVTLSVSSTLPGGVSAAFNPDPVTPVGGGTASSTLALSLSSLVTPGTFTLTVTGASGSLTHSTTATVTVNANSSSITNVIAQLLSAGCIKNSGIANALTSKLSYAQSDISAGNIKAAVNTLSALIKQLNNQSGGQITPSCTVAGITFAPTAALISDVTAFLDSLNANPDPIVGYVVNSSGLGLSGATVSMSNDSVGNSVATTTTDITGFYFFATTGVLTTGSTYTVKVTAFPTGFTTSSPPFQTFTWQGSLITLSNFVLSP